MVAEGLLVGLFFPDRGNLRLLHTWHTTVELQACPECGRFFAPRPTAFLREMLPEVADLWALCPACRARRTAGQWAEQAAREGSPFA